MNNTGLWLSHPSYDESFANKFIVNELNKFENTTIRHIDQLYPDFKIDKETEQEYLLKMDTIILQFPIFWYNYPASMKNWLDTVISYDFCFGPHGEQLQGKNIIISVTTGGPKESYSLNGYNNHTISDYLCGLKQLSYFAKMNYRGIIASYGIKEVENNQLVLKKSLLDHIEAVQNLIISTTKSKPYTNIL